MSSEYAPILLLVALLALFYLVVLRPARRQQQQTKTIQRNLEVGDDVVLSSGIFGTIAGLDDSRVRLEIAPGTVIEVARQVVVRQAENVPGSEPDGAGTDARTDPETDPETEPGSDLGNTPDSTAEKDKD